MTRPNLPSGSLWWDALGDEVSSRPTLDGDVDADVAIIGAGYTGLWTALYLTQADPSIRVVMIEREFAGFGASGRNGGWCSALFATSHETIAKEHGHDAAMRLHRAMVQSVDEVGKSASSLGIDCHYAKGGTVTVARTEAQLERARTEVDSAHKFGLTEEDIRFVGASEAKAELGATNVLGGVLTPHCAAIQPALLARGLAAAVERNSVKLFESTAALAIEPGRVRTSRGTVTADVVVRATEGYTAELTGMERQVIPVYSLMVATEPLSEDFWADAGLQRRQTFADLRHMIIYGQRTADDRIAFGGRGAPYHFGSAIRPSFDQDAAVHAAVRHALIDLFPSLSSARFTHAWGGPLGITRDWHPSVGYNRSAGFAWAGGYVGDGVSTTNLAGRTLADLILSHDTDLVHLPWVGHRSRPWEGEPFRWLGVNAGLRLAGIADRSEERTGRPSRSGALLARLTGN
ncbi:MAG: FAD-binding oxidoreductase [Acidimicrobiales bacterium]